MNHGSLTMNGILIILNKQLDHALALDFLVKFFRGTWNGIEFFIKFLLEQEVTAKNIEDFCNEISILRGLMCMHRTKIVHHDLKNANCLVNKHRILKIYDYGLSRVLTIEHMRDCCSARTPDWMAPELIRNESFTEKCDIFSLGVIIWKLCTLHRPWEGIPSAQVVCVVGHDGTRLEIPEGPLGSLIADCWAEPKQRPNCEEIMSRLISCEMLI